MILTNETKMVDYIHHVQSKIRQLADLEFERRNHPDSKNTPPPPAEVELREHWEKLRSGLMSVLGISIRPFGEATKPGSVIAACNPPEPDFHGLTMGALKKLADKARRKDPTITLMKSWSK